MSDSKPQSLENHARLDPPFHFVASPVLLINLLASIWYLYKNPSFPSIWLVILSLVAIVVLFLVRIYPLKVQDRVIRLEETLRMQRLLPEPLKARIGEISEKQFVALRFASDAELPELVERTLTSALPPEEIKKAIRSWRADHFRV